MKVETFADLIDWTRAVHGRLAECLAHCSTHSERTRAKLLLCRDQKPTPLPIPRIRPALPVAVNA
jgi:hypothetical protein